MPMPIRTITKETPVTTDEVRKFADSLNIGDRIAARLPVTRVWTSTTNFNMLHKTVRATITAKYPYLVGTDYGVFTWNELIFGYYDGSALIDGDGTDVTAGSDASRTKKLKTPKKAA